MDRAFKQSRILTIICLVGFAVVSIYAMSVTHKSHREQARTVYALMGDNAVTLRAIDVLDNRPVEAHNHVDLFHRRLFGLDPDREVIDRNLNDAMSMADHSVRSLINTYEEDNFYRNLIASNISQSVVTDSIQLDMSSYPYYFQYRGKMTITRSTSIVTRSLVSEGFFRDVQRSQTNPHGFLIERYRILENNDLRVDRRFD